MNKTECNSDKSKTITLIRHGEPVIFSNIPILSIVNGAEIRKFLDIYNQCTIILPPAVPLYLKKITETGDFFISSNLKRAKESFTYLGVHKFETNDLFNEAELPNGMFKNLRMPLFIWSFLLRAAWVSGYNRECESIKKFKFRIKRAKEYLDEKMAENSNIVVMAHCMMNFTLGRELKKDNWVLMESVNGSKFWSLKKYCKEMR